MTPSKSHRSNSLKLLLSLVAACLLLSQALTAGQASAATKACSRAGYETIKQFPTASILRKATKPDPDANNVARQKRYNYVYYACSKSLNKFVWLTRTPYGRKKASDADNQLSAPSMFSSHGPFIRFTQHIGDEKDEIIEYRLIDLQNGRRIVLASDAIGIPIPEGENVTKFVENKGIAAWSIHIKGTLKDQIYTFDGKTIKLVAGGTLTGTFTENFAPGPTLGDSSISYILDGIPHADRLDGSFTNCEAVKAGPCWIPYT